MAQESRELGIRTRHDPYAALRLPNYRLFASGFLVSGLGLQMMAMALGWEIYERTKDPLALGFVGLARALPVLLLALPAGQVLDWVDRRRALVLTQVAFGIAAAILAIVSYVQAPIPIVYAVVVLAGCARVFNGPSRATLLPLLVPKDVFPNAVTWNSGVFQFSATVGPLVAGWIIWQTGVAWPVYAVTAAGCLAFAASGSALKPRAQTIVRERKISFAGIFAGASHVWREKTVLGAITLDLFAVLLGGATALLPVYAKDILGVGALELGVLKASPYIGALVMAVVLAHSGPFKRAGRALLWSVAGFGLCTIVFGLSTNFFLSVAMLFALGALDNISVVIRHVLVQVRTPDHLRGRVSAVNSVFIESSNELGAFESGAVAKLFGPVVSVVSGGIGTVLVVLGVALLLPEVRRLGKLEDQSVDVPPATDRAEELAEQAVAPGQEGNGATIAGEEPPGERQPVPVKAG